MSALGRKSMKKTLRSLRQEAVNEMEELVRRLENFIPETEKFQKFRDEFLIKEKRPEDIVEAVKELVTYLDRSHDVIRGYNRIIRPLFIYIMSLEEYSSELDEAWDNYLKTIKKMERAVKEIPPPKKGKKKKTTYID